MADEQLTTSTLDARAIVKPRQASEPALDIEHQRDVLARLKRIAAREGKSVGAVIRDAVDGFIFAEPNRRQRAAAAMLEMNAPVEDWDVMKAQILKSQLGDW